MTCRVKNSFQVGLEFLFLGDTRLDAPVHWRRNTCTEHVHFRTLSLHRQARA